MDNKFVRIGSVVENCRATSVLFLGHDALRAGAPLLLLELIKWLQANGGIHAALLLKRGGEIEGDYQQVIPTQCLTREHQKLNAGLHRRALRKLGLAEVRQPDLKELYPVSQYPLVYANTIDTTDLILQLAGGGRRIIHHVHELSYATEVFRVTKLLQQTEPLTDIYIAASGAVRDFLEGTIGVPANKIRVIHEFAIAIGQTGNREGSENRKDVRRRLGVAEDAFMVGMCGTVDWRKGADLFVQLALQVNRLMTAKPVHFVWLGGNAVKHREPLHDAAKMGLQEVCHFVPAVPNPNNYFNAFDLFALTSREDPFSVAMLEAAGNGLPIVCFDKAGGGPELVEGDAGMIVPYLDVPAMAKACVELLLDEPRRKEMGKNAKRKVLDNYTLNLQAPKIRSVINSLAESKMIISEN